MRKRQSLAISYQHGALHYLEQISLLKVLLRWLRLRRSSNLKSIVKMSISTGTGQDHQTVQQARKLLCRTCILQYEKCIQLPRLHRPISPLTVSQIFFHFFNLSFDIPTPNLDPLNLIWTLKRYIKNCQFPMASSVGGGGKSSFSFDDHLSALSLLIGITNLLPLGSKHGNYNGPSQLPSVIDDRSILKPQAECVNIQQSKRWKCLSKQNLFSCTSPKNVRTHAPSKRKVKKSRTCAKIKSILRFFYHQEKPLRLQTFNR